MSSLSVEQDLVNIQMKSGMQHSIHLS